MPSRTTQSTNTMPRPTAAPGVCMISVIGGPGCGKTSLLDETARQLAGERRVGIISADTAATRGPDHLSRHARVMRIQPASGGSLDRSDIERAANGLIGAGALDLVFIENVGTLTSPATDLGQAATVTVFSVAAGDDKAEKHADLVRSSEAILLNKTDLVTVVPFDVDRFRADVRRLNPEAVLFEISGLTGQGFAPWLDWLKRRSAKNAAASTSGRDQPSHWFG